MSNLLRLVAWASIAALVGLTMLPIELRPHVGVSTALERAAAYAFAGLAVGLAYPRWRWVAPLVIVGLAASLELAQMLTLTRHARLSDFTVKAVAAVLGVLASGLVAALRPNRSARS